MLFRVSIKPWAAFLSGVWRGRVGDRAWLRGWAGRRRVSVSTGSLSGCGHRPCLSGEQCPFRAPTVLAIVPQAGTFPRGSVCVRACVCVHVRACAHACDLGTDHWVAVQLRVVLTCPPCSLHSSWITCANPSHFSGGLNSLKKSYNCIFSIIRYLIT